MKPFIASQTIAISTIALTALASLVGCADEEFTDESLGTTEQASISCNNDNNWDTKAEQARLVMIAAEEFGRWEFTTDLALKRDCTNCNDYVIVSTAGLAQCATLGKTGCPKMTELLSGQFANNGNAIYSGSTRIFDPGHLRSKLVSGWQNQKSYENNQQWLNDSTAPSGLVNFQAPTTTGFPHTITTLEPCVVKVFRDANHTGTSQCLTQGTYNMSQLATVGNDTISSIVVQSGWTVRLYQHDNFGGTNVSFSTNQLSLGTFDNQTSSISIEQTGCAASVFKAFQVNYPGADWHRIRAKLVMAGYTGGVPENDMLQVKFSAMAEKTLLVDPFMVDFVPPAIHLGVNQGVDVAASSGEYWYSSEDPGAILPVGAKCDRQAYNSSTWQRGCTVTSISGRRYCRCQ